MERRGRHDTSLMHIIHKYVMFISCFCSALYVLRQGEKTAMKSVHDWVFVEDLPRAERPRSITNALIDSSANFWST